MRKFHFPKCKKNFFFLRKYKKNFKEWDFLGKNIRIFSQGKVLRQGLEIAPGSPYTYYWNGKANPRTFYEKSKMGASIDQQSKIL